MWAKPQAREGRVSGRERVHLLGFSRTRSDWPDLPDSAEHTAEIPKCNYGNYRYFGTAPRSHPQPIGFSNIRKYPKTLARRSFAKTVCPAPPRKRSEGGDPV